MSWELRILEAGVIPGVPLRAYLPDAPDGAVIDPPCYCCVVTDGKHTVLIDSGPDRGACGRAGLDIIGDSSALLLAGLAAMGVTPRDVDLIVHTHLHYDHVQNDLLFPAATVAVQRTELAWATAPGPSAGRFYVGTRELVTALGDRLRPLDGESEILPGLTALPNGGHTPGHQSVLVEMATEAVCVCGDIVSLRQNLDVVGAACPDTASAEAFLARARAAGWAMLPSHDPAVREHQWYVPAPEPQDIMP